MKDRKRKRGRERCSWEMKKQVKMKRLSHAHVKEKAPTTNVPVRAAAKELLGVIDGDENHAPPVQPQALPQFLQLVLICYTWRARIDRNINQRVFMEM